MIRASRRLLAVGLEFSAVTPLICLLAACSSTSTGPSQTIVAARPQSPADGAQIPFNQQPLTLIFANATTTASSRAMANHVEVASDSAFANVVQSKDVAPDTSVQCSVT